ncbi:MAG: glycogen debranching protein GlgX [Actinomycetes bacterium]
MTQAAEGRAAPLGAVRDGEGTNFAVYSGGEGVELCLYDEEGRESRVALTSRARGVWHGHVPGAGPGTRYGYRVDGPWDPRRGQRFDPAKLLLDPYARAIDGRLRLDDAVVAGRGTDSAPFVPRSVVTAGDFDWSGDRHPAVPWRDTVLYELHVRGFTMRHPTVPHALRGTYAGLAHPAVVEHLVSLGVTTVELLPVHQFVTEPGLARRGRTNVWGYNSVGFFAPHAGYSSAGSGGEQVAEFRSMVRDLHAAGLEVILDVVYNHTGEGGDEGPTLCWRGLDNRAYYRFEPDGGYEDLTGCGNSLDLRHPRCLQMVTDSLRYWVTEMHVDGFRLDLAATLVRGADGFDGTNPFLAVVEQDPVLSQVKLVAEPWDAGPGGYRLGRFPAPWAEWNDRYRDTVRSAWLRHDARPHGSGVRDLAYRLSGSSDVFAASGRGPLASVNFVTAHDGFTLHDLVTYETKRNQGNGEHNLDGANENHGWNCGHEGPTGDPGVLGLRRRMMRNLLTTLVVSTGVPMLTAGDETGRSQDGNNNAYCVDDETYWLGWDHGGWRGDLLAWTRALLEVRRRNRVLRHDDFFEGRPAHDDGVKDLAWFGTDGREMSAEGWFDHDLGVVGLYLSAMPEHGDHETVVSLLVVLNTRPDEQAFSLPGAPWATSYRVLLDTRDERPAPGPRLEPGTTAELAAHSVLLLAAHH